MKLSLQDVLSHIIEDIRPFYDEKETNLIYITIHQPGMVNALNLE
jgi:hypothetical protein